MDWVAFNNEEAPLTLRANTLRTSRDDLARQLERHGVGTEALRFAPDGLRVVEGNPLRTPLSKQGVFIVQDESSQLVTLMAGARARRRTLDACAAPGGKTLALMAGPAQGGFIVAGDRRWRRVKLLREYVQSAGTSGVAIVALDLTRGAPFGDVFDLVLVDAPCTGLGTLRREVDIRWRRSEADIAAAAEVQSRLIRQAAALVAPGGRLVYATCSSEPEENQQVVDAWLADDGRFRRAEGSALASDGVPPAVLDDRGQLQTRPDLHGLEAFFAAAADRVTGADRPQAA
jgi:16S rRNA (cytosine967-C5)-methyltransferase